MATSLYISNERLLAVTGSAGSRRIDVRSFAELALPAGSVINGVITDEAAFAEAVKELSQRMGKQFTNVRIVLNASRIYIKRAVLPKLGKNKLGELIASQFSEVDTDADDELIYDCMPLGDLGAGQGQAVLACAAKRSLVASYADLFEGLKIKLAGLDTTYGAIIKLVEMIDALKESAFIVLGLDGNTLDATLFVHGQFRFNNRTRLIAERGTAACTSEISRMVSSIIQFNTSERSGETVSRVLVIGAIDGEQAMMESISASYDMPVAGFADACDVVRMREGTLDLGLYAYALGNLIGA